MMIVAGGVIAGLSHVAVVQQRAGIEVDIKIGGRFIASSVAAHIAEVRTANKYMELRSILKRIQQEDSRIFFEHEQAGSTKILAETSFDTPDRSG